MTTPIPLPSTTTPLPLIPSTTTTTTTTDTPTLPPLPPAPTDLTEILHQESTLVFPSFDTHTAFHLGTHIRTLLLTLYPTTPTAISITLANSTPLFYCAVIPGTVPDNAVWLARKTATVLRWGRSSWFMGRKYGGDEEVFAGKNGLVGGAKRGEYAIHGGAVPVRVRGLEGVVGVVAVSGLRQEEDHMVVVRGIREVLGLVGLGVGESEAEKRKED